jgi:hypothetical protein
MTNFNTPTAAPIGARAIMARVVADNQHLTCQAQLESVLHKHLKKAGYVNALAFAQAEAKRHIHQRGTNCCIGCKAEHAAKHGQALHTH